MKVKKLLVLTPRFPYPVIGGDRLRIFHICKELSKKYDLTLLSFCETKEEMDSVIPEDGVFAGVERIYLPKWKSYLGCFFSLFSSTPLQVGYYLNRTFKNRVAQLLCEHDGVLAHLIRTGHYVRDTSIPNILEMTDAISMNYERVRKQAKVSGLRNIIYTIEQKRLKAFEKDIVQRFDTSVLVSTVDRKYLFEQDDEPEGKVLVCSNGVNPHFFSFDYTPDMKTLVFIGNMTTVQNLDAARWFATNVMPELVKRGEFYFKVIGKMSKSHINEFSSYVNTYATGMVDSITEEAAEAFIGVCPVRLGAGVQNKVLEYMAMGIPTVTSSVGHEGIDAPVGNAILVADSVGEYIESIVGLSRNITQATKLGVAGKEFVKEAHSWSGMLTPLIERVEVLVSGER